MVMSVHVFLKMLINIVWMISVTDAMGSEYGREWLDIHQIFCSDTARLTV